MSPNRTDLRAGCVLAPDAEGGPSTRGGDDTSTLGRTTHGGAPASGPRRAMVSPVLRLARTLFTTSCALAMGCVACDGTTIGTHPEPTGGAGEIDPGDDPNFEIEPNADGVLGGFNRKVVVFQIPIYAAPAVADATVLHAANVMAQYLDNDEDGEVDNERVIAAMRDANAFMVLWASESDLEGVRPPDGWEGQDLGDAETQPGFVAGGLSGRFDAALEEVLHIITHAGYARAYPDVFGEVPGSSIGDAMDIARGGRFSSVPDRYPEGAWYSYDDPTCDYACMVTEYHYWSLTSRLGAQAHRLDEISDEWRLDTPEKLAATDTAMEALLADPQYAFPTTLPDGTYMR